MLVASDNDCSDVAGDDASDAVVVAEDDDWSIGNEFGAISANEFSSEFWLIVASNRKELSVQSLCCSIEGV